ncbi:MAG: hypothetical protein IJY27_04760 [Clostridia bacterium]|nr:hypothetical protein [Clostridia bacterium]
MKLRKTILYILIGIVIATVLSALITVGILALVGLDELGWIDYGRAPEPDPFEGARMVSGEPERISTMRYGEQNDAEPLVFAINSRRELDNFIKTNTKYFLLDFKAISTGNTESFVEATAKYDKQYFKNRMLIVVYLREGSGSITHSIEKMGLTGGKLRIAIKRTCPEVFTTDVKEWFILIEPEAGVNIKNAANIIVDVGGVVYETN